MANCRPVALAALLTMLAAGACAQGAHPRAARVDEAKVTQFFGHVHKDPDHAWLEESSAAWLEPLSRETRVAIAERALRDADPVVRGIAPVQYYVLGMDDRGDEASATLVVDGVDLAGLGWGWLHSADATLLDRRLRGIRRVVEARYPQLTPAQRVRAREFVCDDAKDCGLTP